MHGEGNLTTRGNWLDSGKLSFLVDLTIRDVLDVCDEVEQCTWYLPEILYSTVLSLYTDCLEQGDVSIMPVAPAEIYDVVYRGVRARWSEVLAAYYPSAGGTRR